MSRVELHKPFRKGDDAHLVFIRKDIKAQG